MPESGIFVRMKMDYENVSKTEHINDAIPSHDVLVQESVSPQSFVIDDDVVSGSSGTRNLNTYEVAAEIHINT